MYEFDGRPRGRCDPSIPWKLRPGSLFRSGADDAGDRRVPDPAISKLEGLLGYWAGGSPAGSMVHVSIWESDDHDEQMGRLKEMIVDARADADAVGVHFIPIINYQIAWSM